MDFTAANEQLEKEIQKVEQLSEKKIVIYTRIIALCREVLEKYRQEIRKRKFINTSEEINFFKKHKQIPLFHLIFYFNLKLFELEAPTESSLLIEYIKNKIKKINKFFITNKEFSLYIDLDQNCLDEFYFTRNFFNGNISTMNTPYFEDLNFSTSRDLLLGEILANKKFLLFLNTQLKIFEAPFCSGEEKEKLQWTSSKVALIELIYALHQTGSINNGSVDLISIASSFEDFFQVKLDNIYKTYSEIKLRKGRRTKFLDELTMRFERKLNQEEEL